MSGIHRTRIEWADSTWNPITGCLHGCPHCYAEELTRRFGPQHGEYPDNDFTTIADHDHRCYVSPQPVKTYCPHSGSYLRTCPYPRGFSPTLHTHKLDHLKNAKTPRRLFVGSMCDMFGEWISTEWINAIFDECKAHPQHVYMFLTQNPERYVELGQAGLLPDGDNFWFGTTTVSAESKYFWSLNCNTFVSIEPILGEFGKLGDRFMPPNWVIVGPMNGRMASKHRPKREWIASLEADCIKEGIPLFMKKELARTWDSALIKEYPEKMLRHIAEHTPNYRKYRGRTLYVEYDGQIVKLLDLSKNTGIPYPALYERYRKGDVEEYVKTRLATEHERPEGKKYRERQNKQGDGSKL